jgi:hypothetical protein
VRLYLTQQAPFLSFVVADGVHAARVRQTLQVDQLLWRAHAFHVDGEHCMPEGICGGRGAREAEADTPSVIPSWSPSFTNCAGVGQRAVNDHCETYRPSLLLVGISTNADGHSLRRRSTRCSANKDPPKEQAGSEFDKAMTVAKLRGASASAM